MKAKGRSNQPTLNDYARRMRTLVEEDMRIAADLRELAKEMRDRGYQASVLKAVVKALVSQEEGDEKPLLRLKARTAEIAMYADALGEPIDGFGERNRFVVNDLPEHDPVTGEIIETESQAKAGDDEDRVAVERAEAKADAPDASELVSRDEPSGERALPRPSGLTPAGAPGSQEPVSAERDPATHDSEGGSHVTAINDIPGSRKPSTDGEAGCVSASTPADEVHSVPPAGLSDEDFLRIPRFLARNPDGTRKYPDAKAGEGA